MSQLAMVQKKFYKKMSIIGYVCLVLSMFLLTFPINAESKFWTLEHSLIPHNEIPYWYFYVCLILGYVLFITSIVSFIISFKQIGIVAQVIGIVTFILTIYIIVYGAVLLYYLFLGDNWVQWRKIDHNLFWWSFVPAVIVITIFASISLVFIVRHKLKTNKKTSTK